jgi:hypothetical protein
MDTWLRSNPRASVADDYEISKTVAIQGSPQIVWPDGTTTHNPGMTDHNWRGGLLHIGRTDNAAPERLLLRQMSAATGHHNGP